MNETDWDRIAEDYYTEILSPIKNCHENPMFSDIDTLPNRFKTAIDLGCGLGPLLPRLARKFENVVGLDFSKKMIAAAREKTAKLGNVECFVGDMRKLKTHYNRYDAVFSVNSILAKNHTDVKKIVKEIFNVLRDGGMLFAILPSMEVYLHQAQLIVDQEIKKGKSQAVARKTARKHIKKSIHDFILGTITFDGDTQKCFYSFEIPRLFKEAGFKNITIDKVTYTWEEYSKAGQAHFPGAELPWDWYVKCEK